MRNPYIGLVATELCLFTVFCPLTVLFNADVAERLSEIDGVVEKAAYVFEHNSNQGALLLLFGFFIILLSALIAFRIAHRYRDPHADPIETPALIFTIAVCACIFAATLVLLNNPILWAFGVLIACLFGLSKALD